MTSSLDKYEGTCRVGREEEGSSYVTHDPSYYWGGSAGVVRGKQMGWKKDHVAKACYYYQVPHKAPQGPYPFPGSFLCTYVHSSFDKIVILVH